jgi:hypothetical protein
MASLRIPEEYKGGIVKLLKLSDEDAQKLLSVLQSIPITNTLKQELSEKVFALGTITKSDADEIADALRSLSLVLAYSNEPPSEFVDGLAEAMEESGDEELKLPDEIRDNIKQRLTKFLDIDSLIVSAKAEGVMYEYENVFSTARVLTDIRPVFGLNAEEPPKAATITHMLSIHYSHSGDHKEIQIALDEIDLEDLMDAFERANTKAESLKSILEMAKLFHIEP